MSQSSSNARSRARAFALLGRVAPLVFLLILVVIFTTLQPRFLSPLNLFNILRQVSIYGIIAVGMTFVIITRGIDLSVGSLVALSGIIAAVVAKGGIEGRFLLVGDGGGFSWPIAAFAAVLVGAFAGFLQGVTVAKLAVPAFVVTLGGMTVFRGLTLTVGNGGPVSGFDEFFGWWGRGMVGPVPVPVIVFAVVALIAHFVLTQTRFGRSVYAVGSNPDAARLSGINTSRVTILVYAIVGFCSGLGGFVLAARLNSAEAVAGAGYELTAIAAVVIGGTSLYGGTGSVIGTVIGALLTGVLLNGLVILNVSPYTQQILVGLIIVAAVAFDSFIKRQSR
ncbi:MULTISPECIES: ABC transporter permease [Ochrobactrum]|jgi:inositol transport system permease protein|uniref:ABC transporter permease n=1 Tax=Ochrobactrum quorumnocens TaxID=271865 RepID=A0A5N1JTA9_9HYPH|nr:MULTISPECIES: ABC transporter permease [Brucella/Ochrobactrum group]KAA9367417.1 ABC transporter permease [[Ochrobactrum] quorumnocens]MBD7992234.1 ABC transporter permease [Ochrobactrum gallinarum]MDH7792383.1 inositol transport system permease protein [Ochrobactrum sp. AN78]